MLFRFLGDVVRRAWPLLLLGWGFVLAGTWLAAPPWSDVAQDREFAFLPANAPSRRAEEVFATAFPEEHLGSNIVLIVHRSDNARGHLDQDRKFIEDVLEPGLREIAKSEGGLAAEPAPSDEPLFGGEPEQLAPSGKQPIIARIRTPNAPGVGGLLVSPDGQALLVVVELTTEFLATRNWPIIDKIDGLVSDLRTQGRLPTGIEIALTGSAPIGRDHALAQFRSARATELLTVVLVVALLVLIYRAPLLAAIPLVTVYLAVQVSRNILAILGGAGYLTLFQGIEIYITILAYGAGVDYCLFLTARYQEELDHGAGAAEAVSRAVAGTGAALVASAATVMFGIGMMSFAEFGKFREAGLAIPLSIFLVLCATLTFSPALLRLAGRWAFWPRRPRPTAGASSDSTTKPRCGQAFDSSDRLQRFWCSVGEWLLRRAGRVWLVTAAVMAPAAAAGVLLSGRLSYDLIGNLPPDAPGVAGTRVLQEHFPAGIVGPVTVLLVNPKVDFGSPPGEALVDDLTSQLRAQSKELGLADVRSLTAPLGTTVSTDAGANPDVPDETRREATRQAARQHYLTDLGGRTKVGTRLELVLEEGPFSHGSVEALGPIESAVRDSLPAGLRQDAQLYLVGPTASVRDVADVVRRDRSRIEILVLACVLVILVILLRGLIVPLYLLLSVLFSYYATLGVSFLVFWLFDPHGFTGIDWKVAVFLFTILIAVGEDYNIFLLTRVHEEQRRHGPVRGITEALARTGPIISSCGVIMAGTFSSLLAGSLTEMKQLGFALAFGVLLDTFVVRPVLVPAFLILLARRRRTSAPPEPSRPDRALDRHPAAG